MQAVRHRATCKPSRLPKSKREKASKVGIASELPAEKRICKMYRVIPLSIRFLTLLLLAGSLNAFGVHSLKKFFVQHPYPAWAGAVRKSSLPGLGTSRGRPIFPSGKMGLGRNSSLSPPLDENNI